MSKPIVLGQQTLNQPLEFLRLLQSQAAKHFFTTWLIEKSSPPAIVALLYSSHFLRDQDAIKSYHSAVYQGFHQTKGHLI